jgi:SAM-dependent methyltransferase
MTKNSEQRQFRVRHPRVDALGLAPTNQELVQYFAQKYEHAGQLGSSPKLRLEHEFVSADDFYETLVSKLVTPGIRWLDVGSGRYVFPSNQPGAKVLAERCASFVGVDPDDNVLENELLTDRFHGVIEDYSTAERFDLVTLRMVAEHIQAPERTVAKLAEITKPGGLVVIYTPWKWAPMSLIASLIPFAFHNTLKRLIWDSESRDTFPTAYKMNSRDTLRSLFTGRGFEESYFADVDDCSVFTRYLGLNAAEISARNLCLKLGVTYWEHCLLAIYRRLPAE